MKELWKLIYRWIRAENAYPYFDEHRVAAVDATTQYLMSHDVDPAIYVALYERAIKARLEYRDIYEEYPEYYESADTYILRYQSDGVRFAKVMTADGDSYTKWCVVPRPVKNLRTFLAEHFPVQRIYSDYDCTGRWFSWTPTIHRTPTGLTIHQHWGRDI